MAANGPSSDSLSAWSPGGVNDWNSFNAALTIARPGSIEAWFFCPTHTGTVRQIVAWDGVSAGSLAIFITAANKLELVAPAGAPVVSAAVIPTGQWNHVVYTNDGTTANLYLNGVNVGSVGGQSVGSFTGSVYVAGRAQVAGEANLCFFSEVASYGAALTSGQVGAHYAAADLKSVPLVGFLTPAISIGPGIQPVVGSLLDLIYKAVHKTY